MKAETELHRAIRACRSTGLGLFVSSACINLLMLASPLYMMQVYDRVLASRSIDTLVMLTLVTGGALAALSALDGLRGHIFSRVGVWLDDRLSPVVIGAGLHAALRGGPATRTSDALRDLSTVRNFLAGPIITPLMDAPWAPLFLAVMFLLHPVLGIAGVLSALVILALALVNEFATKAYLRRANVAATRSLNTLDAAFRNAEAIHAMGMLPGVLRLWQREARQGKEAHNTAAVRAAVILAISKFVRLMVQSGVMGVGAWLVIEQHASPGILFGSTFILGRALAPMENAIGTWKSLVTTRLAYHRLNKLLEAAPCASPEAMPIPAPAGRLSVEQAVFALPQAEAPILRGVSFTAEPGEILGIIGPSAAGKSTLARLIAGIWRPSSGHVRLDGAEIGVWLASGGARHFGYLPQDVELFAGSVKDNIARLGEAAPAAVIEAANLAGLHETIMNLPRAYDTEIGEGGIKLSGGQRQRIALARALFGNPQLVILDEPNASLDHEGEEALVQAIAQLKARGATVLVIAHRPSVLAQADRLLVLRNGTVAALGPRRDIMAQINGMAVVPPQRPAAFGARQTV